MALKLVFTFMFVLLVCGSAHETPLTVSDPIALIKHHASKINHDLDPEVLALLTNLKETIFNEKFLATASNNTCENSIKQLVVDLLSFQNPYAITIADSWFKPESGLLDGNICWEGRLYECVTSKGPKFGGKYCSTAIPLGSALNPYGELAQGSLLMGLCFPDTCSDADLTELLARYIPSGIFSGVWCPPYSYPNWEAKDIIAFIFTTCDRYLSINEVYFTENSYDLTPKWSYDKVNKRQNDLTAKVISTLLGLIVFSCTIYEIYHVSSSCSEGSFFGYDLMNSPEQEAVQSKMHRFLLSFSVIQNTKRLLSTTRRPTDINCLHGLRFFSMSWVILGHSFLFFLSYADNPRFFARYAISHYEFQAILSAFYSVDSFFFLSGLLVVYLGLRELNRREGKINVPLMYLFRYLRLTPPYAYVLMMSITIWPKFGEGPMWTISAQSLIDSCQKYWYTNLLYFNNLYPSTIPEQCFGWGWYLANDTQFYLMTPLLLWILYRSRKWGIALISFLLVSSIAITGTFSALSDQQSTTMSYGLIAKGAAAPIQFPNQTIDLYAASNNTYQQNPYIEDLYGKPWCRIGAYLVGMITGYILHATNNKIHMNKVVVVFGWLVAFFICFELMYCAFPAYSTGHPWSISLAAFYNAVCRPAWCIGLAWLTIACVSGYGGPVNAFLSWKVFMPLSRLTYCSYLIHPLVLWWFLGNNEVQLHFNIYQAVMLFLTALIVTTLLAYVTAMLVEFPVIELMKLMQSKRRKEASPTVQASEMFRTIT